LICYSTRYALRKPRSTWIALEQRFDAGKYPPKLSGEISMKRISFTLELGIIRAVTTRTTSLRMGANMKKAFTLAMGIPLLMIGAANAQQKQNYAEVGYVALRYSEPGAKASPSAGRLIVGSNVMDNLGVEVMGAMGLGSGTADGVSVKLDSGFGAFLRPQLNLGDALQVFGRVGYFRSSITGKSGPVEVKTSGGDIAYGVGLSYGVTDRVAITGDYMWYYDKSSVAIKGFSIGAKFGF
jgi:hypothetical protein